jgi:4-carboxymuconolactone decarboxylase
MWRKPKTSYRAAMVVEPVTVTTLWVLACSLIAAGANAQERLGPVPPENYTAEQKSVVAEIASGPRKEMFSPLLPMLRSPELAYTTERFGEYVYYKSQLEKRIYELAVLLLARQTTQQFEWRVHYDLAIKSGIARETVDAIGAGKRPPHLAADEAVAYDFIVQLYTKAAISDAAYARFVEKFGERGVVDLVGLLGYYNTIALMMNVDRTPLNPGTAPPLKPLKQPLPMP